jgi:hypothetical protein
MVALLALQCFVVLFVALHNCIPLGTLNNVKGVRVEFPTGKLLVTTLINFTPVAIGLAATAFCKIWLNGGVLRIPGAASPALLAGRPRAWL